MLYTVLKDRLVSSRPLYQSPHLTLTAASPALLTTSDWLASSLTLSEWLSSSSFTCKTSLLWAILLVVAGWRLVFDILFLVRFVVAIVLACTILLLLNLFRLFLGHFAFCGLLDGTLLALGVGFDFLSKIRGVRVARLWTVVRL